MMHISVAGALIENRLQIPKVCVNSIELFAHYVLEDGERSFCLGVLSRKAGETKALWPPGNISERD